MKTFGFFVLLIATSAAALKAKKIEVREAFVERALDQSTVTVIVESTVTANCQPIAYTVTSSTGIVASPTTSGSVTSSASSTVIVGTSSSTSMTPPASASIPTGTTVSSVERSTTVSSTHSVPTSSVSSWTPKTAPSGGAGSVHQGVAALAAGLVAMAALVELV